MSNNIVVRPPPPQNEGKSIHRLKEMITRSRLRTRTYFPPSFEGIEDDTSVLESQIERNEYSHLPEKSKKKKFRKPKRKPKKTKKITGEKRKREGEEEEEEEISNQQKSSTALSLINKSSSASTFQKALVRLEKRRRIDRTKKPDWHPPWKLYRVISAHLGWVRALSVDTTNDFFVSGSADRTIKIWDLATGKLRLTLTGHSNTIRDMVLSDRHPYLFTVGEDKAIKVWDLEQNKCIKAFHGHLSGVYCCDLHPTIDVLVTGGRDSTARVWDIRTKAEVMLFTGHNGVVGSVKCQGVDPQVVTGSMDATVRLWDMAKGVSRAILTHHKKSIRSIAIHPTEYTFASAAADRMKKWLCPDGKFMGNFEQPPNHIPSPIINSTCINGDGVMIAGTNDGRILSYDWKTMTCFQEEQVKVQSGSLQQAESGILVAKFDRSGSRLITGEVDKTIKMWKEDETATPQSHPLKERESQFEYW